MVSGHWSLQRTGDRQTHDWRAPVTVDDFSSGDGLIVHSALVVSSVDHHRSLPRGMNRDPIVWFPGGL